MVHLSPPPLPARRLAQHSIPKGRWYARAAGLAAGRVKKKVARGDSVGRQRGGQRERERRALLDLRLGPRPAAVPGDEALHGGQADTVALELVRGVQALEGAEQVLSLIHISEPTRLGMI